MRPGTLRRQWIEYSISAQLSTRMPTAMFYTSIGNGSYTTCVVVRFVQSGGKIEDHIMLRRTTEWGQCYESQHYGRRERIYVVTRERRQLRYLKLRITSPSEGQWQVEMETKDCTMYCQGWQSENRTMWFWCCNESFIRKSKYNIVDTQDQNIIIDCT